MGESDKRGEIVRAALELIAGEGFHGVSMAMIADKAKVGMGTIYRHFQNKDALIVEMYKDLEAEVLEIIGEDFPLDKPVKDRFSHVGTRLMRYFIAEPLKCRYVEQYHSSPYGATLRGSLILGEFKGKNMFVELFQEGVACGVMKDLPLLMLFALAFGPWMALMRDHIFSLIQLDDTLIRQAVEASWHCVEMRTEACHV